MAHFDREVIPERRMHAKGSGAFGHFTVTHDVTDYTCASLFSVVGKRTDVFVRFSTVAGERGAADAERDIRAFGQALSLFLLYLQKSLVSWRGIFLHNYLL